METSRREIVLINRPEPGPASHWDTTEKIARIVSLATIPVVLAVVGWLIQESLQKQTISRDYVQLAVSVLKKHDPEQENALLRNWAVDLLTANSPVPLNEELVAQLKSGKTILPANLTALLQAAKSALVVAPDGKLGAVCEPGEVRLVDLASGQTLSKLSMNGSTQNYAAFSPDARYIATGDETGHARIWEITTGRQLRVRQVDESIQGLAFSPDGTNLFILPYDRPVVAWSQRPSP